MGREVVLTLNDGLYNAGIRGFLRVCEFGKLIVKKEKNKIIFDSDILQDFTKYYLQALIEFFYDDTVYAEIVKRYVELQTIREISEENEKRVHENVKYILEKLERKSYQAAYSIVHSRGESFDFENAIKTCKKEKEIAKKIELLKKILPMLQKYDDVFLLKDIAYTKIQPFWTSVAFLNSKENKSEFTACFDKSFGEPANHFVPKTGKKATVTCCQCEIGLSLNKKDAASMGWINDVGVDVARKTSYYWNFHVDSFLCPICNLIYACLPMGFTMKGSEGIFINDNESVHQILAMNKVPDAKFSTQKEDLYYYVMDLFRQQNENMTAVKEIENIQIIRRSGGQYIFNILSKKKLKVLQNCNSDLERLVGVSFRLGDDYLNIYQLVMSSILEGKNLYPLIYATLHEGISKGKGIRFVQSLIKIQIAVWGGGDERMEEKTREKAVYSIMKLGEGLRTAMTAGKQNESKVRTLSYKLLNALKVRNPEEFMDIILRNYIGLGLLVPNSFLDVLKNEEKFLNFGYAFVAGLNGGISKEKADKEEAK